MISFIYIVLVIFSLYIGLKVARNIIEKNEQSSISLLIRWFAGLGISLSIFGFLYLGVHVIYNTYDTTNDWEIKERFTAKEKNLASLHSNTTKEVKKYNFDFSTLTFEEDIQETATIIFTLSGLFLGALGVLWLGYLENTSLQKNRRHDQEKQEDRIKSLLALGIDIFIKIDANELDFMYDTKEKNSLIRNTIVWNKKYFAPFVKEFFVAQKDEKLETAYTKHLTSLYEFLYREKNFKRTTILEDIYKIIEELKVLYYEQDLILYDKQTQNNQKKRDGFIKLLKEYSDYKNFLNGNTFESDFTIETDESFEKKLSTLLKATKKQADHPLDYLLKHYNKNYENNKDQPFYDYFTNTISKEFVEIYLVKESFIFDTFSVISIKNIFEMMHISHHNPQKFFTAYFQESFLNYVDTKAKYSSIDLVEKDLTFSEYLIIMQNSFIQIEADIKSVQELYALFESFVQLFTIYNEGK